MSARGQNSFSMVSASSICVPLCLILLVTFFEQVSPRPLSARLESQSSDDKHELFEVMAEYLSFPFASLLLIEFDP